MKKNYIIYGCGKTGRGLKTMLDKLGEHYVFFDDEHGFSAVGDFSADSVVLVSPGVMPDAGGILAAKKVGSTVVGELDFCFGFCKSPCVSVTGTNGKTTTCRLIYHILQFAGRKSRLLGNGGIPFSSEVLDIGDDETVVLESSSFQLENARIFSPYISVLTNVAPDHLDHHKSFDSYISAKCNNFLRQSADAFSVFNADDKNALALSEVSRAQKLFYSTHNRNANCYFADGAVHVDFQNETRVVPSEFLSKLLLHNLSDTLCAILVCRILGVPPEVSCKAVESYRNLPHRLQTVAEFNDVLFVDDSKATNVHATLGALASFENVPVGLILGGSDKGCSFDEIFSDIGTNVKIICAVGQTAEKIAETSQRYSVSVRLCESYRQAVEMCYSRLKNIGGVVLMSNACASFDMFNGYAQRGEHFAKIVGELCRAQKNG